MARVLLRTSAVHFAATAIPASAQVEALQYDSAKLPVGRVYQYLKSNRDGSHPGRVTLYVARTDRLESLKGDDEVGCRYRIGGPGLSEPSGTLWADAALGHVVEFELPIPDEPGSSTAGCACSRCRA